MRSPAYSPYGSSFSSHDEAFEQALKSYLATIQPYLRFQAMETLSKHLIHPRQILQTPLLTESHPLKKEALIISDAFEALTNGMYHHGVMDELDTLPSDSLFQPWRHFILALYFFYENLEEGCQAHLDEIPPHSPLTCFKGIFPHLFHPQTTSGSAATSTVAGKLIQSIFRVNPTLENTIQQMGDALDTQMEDQFFQAMEETLELPLESQGPQALILWAWNQMAWQNFDELKLLELSEKYLGKAQSCRLAALGSLGYDPEGALLFWGRFLLESLRENAFELVEAHEAWKLFFEFIMAVHDFQEEQGPVDGWEKDWQAFSVVWKHEVSENLNPGWDLPPTWAGAKKLAVQKLRPLTEIPKKEGASAPQSTLARVPKPQNDDGQLELFS